MFKVKGIGAAPGIAAGKAFVLPHWEWDVPEKDIDVSEMANEFERLYKVIHTSKGEIEAIKRDVSEVIGHEELNIFDTHLAILEDPVFMNEIQGIIQRQYKAAEVAVKEVIEKFVTMFDLLEDDYMKERAADIKDVGNRLLKHLLGTPDVLLPTDNQPFILVVGELPPSQLAHLNPELVHGIVTMVGGRDSHSAILARSMGIPLVSGVEDQLSQPIHTGVDLIVDGNEGYVYIKPDAPTKIQFAEYKEQLVTNQRKLQQLVDVPAITKDDLSLSLQVNISSLKEVEQALKNGAEGVGLFRTEFLYMDRYCLPDEEEQYEVFRQVAERLAGKPLVIRTFDIGGDKQLDYLRLPEEDNPFLGYRAIRISLDRQNLFKTQLKAILRAGRHGDVKIMYPMISSLDEVLQAKEVMEEAKRELAAEGKEFASDMEVGIMIEVPAAAAIADILAQEVDFFSIGTNDLVQYVLAVDRMNEKIAAMFDPFHPAIIRLVRQSIVAAKTHGIRVEVCGELAGDIRALPLWLGLGVDSLSMSVQSLLEVKNYVLNSTKTDSQEILESVLQCKTGHEISEILQHAASGIEQSIGGNHI